MKIIISNVSELPIYQQIKDQIKDAILFGSLSEGEQLPSIRSLANDLRVSVITIRRVYNDLESEKLIFSKPGKGSFVASENLEMLRESKRHLIELKLTDICRDAQTLGITKEELLNMVDLLFEEEDL